MPRIGFRPNHTPKEALQIMKLPLPPLERGEPPYMKQAADFLKVPDNDWHNVYEGLTMAIRLLETNNEAAIAMKNDVNGLRDILRGIIQQCMSKRNRVHQYALFTLGVFVGNGNFKDEIQKDIHFVIDAVLSIAANTGNRGIKENEQYAKKFMSDLAERLDANMLVKKLISLNKYKELDARMLDAASTFLKEACAKLDLTQQNVKKTVASAKFLENVAHFVSCKSLVARKNAENILDKLKSNSKLDERLEKAVTDRAVLRDAKKALAKIRRDAAEEEAAEAEPGVEAEAEADAEAEVQNGAAAAAAQMERPPSAASGSGAVTRNSRSGTANTSASRRTGNRTSRQGAANTASTSGVVARPRVNGSTAATTRASRQGEASSSRAGTTSAQQPTAQRATTARHQITAQQSTPAVARRGRSNATAGTSGIPVTGQKRSQRQSQQDHANRLSQHHPRNQGALEERQSSVRNDRFGFRGNNTGRRSTRGGQTQPVRRRGNAQPSTAQPSTTQPSATQPSAMQSSATAEQLIDTKPSTTVTVQPSATEPSTTQSPGRKHTIESLRQRMEALDTAPTESNPIATEPIATQPSTTQPPARNPNIDDLWRRLELLRGKTPTESNPIATQPSPRNHTSPIRLVTPAGTGESILQQALGNAPTLSVEYQTIEAISAMNANNITESPNDNQPRQSARLENKRKNRSLFDSIFENEMDGEDLFADDGKDLLGDDDDEDDFFGPSREKRPRGC